MSINKPRVVVVGGGIAGAASALRAAQYYLPTTWILGDKQTAKASRNEYVYNVDNMIGIHPWIMQNKIGAHLEKAEHETAAAAVRDAHFTISTADITHNVIERLKAQYTDLVTFVEDAADSATQTEGGFEVQTRGGDTVQGEYLVLATGVMDRQPSIKLKTKSGRVRDDIKWIYPYANLESILYCIRCEGHLTRHTPTAVIGDGSAAAGIAAMLHERYGQDVVLLTNGESLSCGDEQRQLLEAYDIPVHTSRIVGFADGQRIKGKELRGIDLEDGTHVEVAFGFISMGLYRIYNELAVELGATLDERDADQPQDLRHVHVEERTSETSVPNLFAVGDMSRRDGPSLKQIYTAQEYAVRAVDTIDRRIRRALREKILNADTAKQSAGAK